MEIWTWSVRSKGLGQADDLVEAISRSRRWDSVCRGVLEKAKKSVVACVEDLFLMSRHAAKAHGLPASSSTPTGCASSHPSASCAGVVGLSSA